ncbi:hypothetical protein [Methylobacterium tarhaniae]|uniref:hypothetical protein n=1 Tax=Methylobacterium tarhaniae TaxID=1187852 RepID=UPI0012EEAA4C|nr:hypothetical protein [Methylobacterium tarhaniae]
MIPKFYTTGFLIFIAFDFYPSEAFCMSKEKEKIVAQLFEVMKQACFINTKRSGVEFSADANLAAILGRIPGASVGGGTKYIENKAEGFSAFLQKELTKEGLELSKMQLECTIKFGAMIADTINRPENINGSAASDRHPGRETIINPDNKDIPLSEGSSESLLSDGVILTLTKVVYRADKFFVYVRLDGEEHRMEAGTSIRIASPKHNCRLTLLQVMKRNDALFNLRCR